MFEFSKKKADETQNDVKIESQVPTQKPTVGMEPAKAEAGTGLMGTKDVKEPVTVGAGLKIEASGGSKPIEIEKEEAKPVAEKKDSNVFTDLFPKKDNSTKTDGKLIDSLNASTSQKNILKPKKNDKDLLIYKKPTLGVNILKVIVLAGLLLCAYLYSQLSPTFTVLGENPVQERVSTYDQVLDLQSEVSKQNYALAKLSLDDYLYTADSYLHKVNLFKSNLVSQKEKAKLESEFQTLRAKMREDLLLASEKLLNKSIPDNLPPHFEEGKSHPQEFKAALKSGIREDIAAASDGDDPDKVVFMRSVSKLADNETIKPKLNQLKPPTMTDNEFKEMADILADSNASGFAALAAIRKDRIKWSEIIEEIENVTKSVDQLFANQFLKGNVGQIFYSSYNLDRKNDAISIIGETLSDDGKNFSLSADLLDAFETSDMFTDIEMDSFTKSKEQNDSFKGILTIDLKLE
ncbi:hypothetical protein HOG48_04080 [Candidatus Peregrinibacteria bacterium]|jgi:hypothetical protein|nr:hypothetical protein [Candidatus Peregrinibacteria bacterium]